MNRQLIFRFTIIGTIVVVPILILFISHEAAAAAAGSSINTDDNDNNMVHYDADADVDVNDDDDASNNVYQQKTRKPKTHSSGAAAAASTHNSSAYGDDLPSHSGLAQVISSNFNRQPQTLDRIYNTQQTAYGTTVVNSQSTTTATISRKETLIRLNFARDFEQWNPRNNDSQWEWLLSTDPNNPDDNAAFTVVNKNSNNPYQYDGNKKNDDSFVDMISLPFNKVYPESDGYVEGGLVTKASYTVGAGQRLLLRMTMTCQTFNTEQHPFPRYMVKNPQDAPRLANCGFGLYPTYTDGSSAYYWFSITNQGIWGYTSRAYGDIAVPAALQYVAKRRVAARPRYDSLVDGAVEIDTFLNIVNYYINGYLVWTVPIGIPPPADGITSLNLGQGTPQPATFAGIQVLLGTEKCLDEFDPNNQTSHVRLVRLRPPSSFYYAADDQFYDPLSLRSNQLWGQGARMRLFKLLLARADFVPPSAAAQQVVLPGVYGPQVQAYYQT